MNKKYLSILVIVITLALSIFMIINNRSKSSESDLIQVKNINSETNETIVGEKDIEEINFAELGELLNSIEGTIKTSDDIKPENKNVSKEEEQNINLDIDGKQIVNDTIEIEENDESSLENDEKEIAVFKVDKTTILGSLSFDEKLMLLDLSKELSMNDYATIVKSIKNKGELECVREVNRILESRLSPVSYEAIKEVIEPYINIEVLE